MGCVGAGCTRSRASELFSTKKTYPQGRLRVLSYRATLDVPIATVRTVSGWLIAHRRVQDILVLRWLIKDGTEENQGQETGD